ncbi:unnamed protein product [Rhizophagus irregularis]|nr:unnamed protein product [Rhizophagus irregularis]
MRSLLWELPISKLDALEEKLKHEKTIDDLCIEGIQNLISSLDAFLDEKSNTSEAEDIYLKIYSSGILTNGEIVYATNNRICYGKVLILAEISLLPNNHPTFPIALIRWYDYCSKRHLTKYGCSYMKLINSYDIIPFDSIVEVVHMVKRSFKDPKNSKILKDSLVILGFFKDPHLKKLTDEFGSTQWRDYYKAEVNQKVFGNKLRELSTAEGTEEELYSLSCKYCMNRTELRLRAYYVTILNKPADQLMPITDSIQKYGKFRTKYGLIINSKLSNRKGDVARKNFCIAVKLLVDKNAHRPNAPIILEEREFFGEVRNPRPSGHGPLKFRDLGAFEVINISAIDRNVGFLKMPNNELYIIDRENRVKFR